MKTPNFLFSSAAATTLAVTVCMAACSGGSPAGDLPVVNVTKSYPKKELSLQRIATVEYLPLETKEGFLLGSWVNVDYLDDEIIVTHHDQGDIMTFDRKTGKTLRSFNRTGRGPGEYPGVGKVVVDREANEMYVEPNSITHGGQNMFQVYNMEGKYLRSLPLRGTSFTEALHIYDADWLFFYDDGGSKIDNLDPQPYVLMSRRDTAVTRLPLKWPARNTMTIVREVNGGMSWHAGGSEMVALAEDGLVFSEPGVDTIFHWNPRTEELTPVMVQTPAFNSMEFPIGLFWRGETNDYTFLQTVERKMNDDFQGFNSVDLVIDKRSGEIFDVRIVNDDIEWSNYYGPKIQMGVPPRHDVQSMQAYVLLDHLENGRLKGPLAEIAAKLKEDDNPVLMIVKF